MSHELKFQVGQMVKVVADDYHKGFEKEGYGIGSIRTIKEVEKESREGDISSNYQEYLLDEHEGTYCWYAESDLERHMKFKVGDEVRITSLGPIPDVCRSRVGAIHTVEGVEPESCTGTAPSNYQEYKLSGDHWAAECGLELVTAVQPCGPWVANTKG